MIIAVRDSVLRTCINVQIDAEFHIQNDILRMIPTSLRCSLHIRRCPYSTQVVRTSIQR